jgi:multiple sugar transport system permease protein
MREAQQTARSIFIYILLLGLVLFVNYPFVWMIITSFKSQAEIFVLPSTLLPKKFLWTNYVEAWNMAPWMVYIKNSLICSIFPIFGQIVFGSLAAYAFTRKFKGRNVLFTFILGTLMIPGHATLIPNYVIFKYLGWINTYLALTIPFLSGAFSIFLIRQYFLSIPKDYEDAADLDGCGPFYYIFRILMPLSKSALMTVGLMAFNDRWNDYLYSLIMTTKDAMRTIQVGLAVFRGEIATEWQYLTAISVFVSMPVILLFLLVQKRFIDGVMMSGVKG